MSVMTQTACTTRWALSRMLISILSEVRGRVKVDWTSRQTSSRAAIRKSPVFLVVSLPVCYRESSRRSRRSHTHTFNAPKR